MSAIRLNAKETLAFDWYFFKLDLLLAGMPNKQVKEIKRDLKNAVLETATEGNKTIKEALADLGSTTSVASNYLEAFGRPVPRVWAGILAFAVLLYGWLLGVISLLEGMHDTARALEVSSSQTITSNWLFVSAFAEVGPTGIDGFGFTISGWNLLGFLAVMIIIPLMCARIWRVWRT